MNKASPKSLAATPAYLFLDRTAPQREDTFSVHEVKAADKASNSG